MLKAGIFLDVENFRRNGGYGIRFEVIRKLMEAQGCTIVRANAYLAQDTKREKEDRELFSSQDNFRRILRSMGYKLILKSVQRYKGADGEMYAKANADVDMTVDAMTQCSGLDYVLLGTGDGDFTPLLKVLQNSGKRVFVLTLDNAHKSLRDEADYHFNGFLVPGMIPTRDPKKSYGFIHWIDLEKGFGFLTMRTGLRIEEVDTSVFVHKKQIKILEQDITDEQFQDLMMKGTVLEFDLTQGPKSPVANNVEVYQWKDSDGAFHLNSLSRVCDPLIKTRSPRAPGSPTM